MAIKHLLSTLVLVLIAFDVLERWGVEQFNINQDGVNNNVMEVFIPKLSSQHYGELTHLLDSLDSEGKGDSKSSYEEHIDEQGRQQVFYSGDWRYHLQAVVLTTKSNQTRFALLSATNIKNGEKKLLQANHGQQFNGFNIAIENINVVHLWNENRSIELVMYKQKEVDAAVSGKAQG
ncbi:hypothetical protein [Pseudoalteromonas xiamenensis]